jgi:hypothetical protein
MQIWHVQIWHVQIGMFFGGDGEGPMKHATASALDRLTGLLAEIRQAQPLKEKSRGVFYCRAKAFLHFHQDPAGLFADIRTGPGWERMPVDSKADQAKLLRLLRRHVAALS